MTLLENAKIVSFDPPSVSGPSDIVFEGAEIVATGDGLREKYPDAQREDVHGAYASPGLVCSHTHLYSALARGILTEIKPSKDFCQQLRNLWWRLDRAIDIPIMRSSALAGLADAAACGVTFVIDHHSSPECVDGSLSVIRSAYKTVGLGGILCYETTDRNGKEGAAAGIRENGRFAAEMDKETPGGAHHDVEAAIGAHAPFTLSDETLEGIADVMTSTGRGLHIHAAEDRYDAVDSRHRFGKDIACRLDGYGLLHQGTILAHGVHLTEGERDLINERGSFLAHNARSNMNNSVGYNPLLSGYSNVVLGTDGMGADMLEEFKFACFRHRESGGSWWPDDFLKTLHAGNRLAELYTGGLYGKIAPGYRSDIVIWDYDPPTPLSGDNLAGHMAFGMSSRSVKSVMAAGKYVIRDRKPLFDSEAILAEARTQAVRLWLRMDERK